MTGQSGPSKWRKKPVVIEAWQVPAVLPDITNPAIGALVAWCGGLEVAHLDDEQNCDGSWVTAFIIETMEGPMRAGPGWWVIRGVKGEFYACEPEIFSLTYEEVG